MIKVAQIVQKMVHQPLLTIDVTIKSTKELHAEPLHDDSSDKDEKDAVIADDTVKSVHTDCFKNGDPIEFFEENDLKAYDTSNIASMH